MQVLAAANLKMGALTGYSFNKDPFIQNMYSKVIETIEHSGNIPGLKSEEFNNIKIGIKERWTELVDKGVLEVKDTDDKVRPYFVALQAIVEHVLAYELGKSVQSLTGVIHTPMPATPLCAEGDVSKELVDPSIEKDSLRLFTVKARATIVRDYLYQGGDLYIVYPQEGMTKRNQSQQQTYKKELENYPAHLFDRPLNCESIANDLVGAFYLFKNTEEKLFAFAIKMTQANNPQALGSFGLWFGEVTKSSPVSDRILNILENVLKHSSQYIPLPL